MAKILLAEDEAVIRMLLADVLVDDGHQVIEAGDGVQALSLITADVSLIISDVMMPRMGGHEWVPTARERPGLAKIPVIFMSALPLPDSARALATVALQKPFSPMIIGRVVRQALTDS